MCVPNHAPCAGHSFGPCVRTLTNRAFLNPASQYHDFGQDVHVLYTNVGQLEKVYQTVKTRCARRIPANNPFHDASSLNSLLEEPFKTVKECWALLRQRDSFSEEHGAIKNIYWNILIEADVASLHKKIRAHNAKIANLLKPLEMCVAMRPF